MLVGDKCGHTAYGQPQNTPLYYEICGICVALDTGFIEFLVLQAERDGTKTPFAPAEDPYTKKPMEREEPSGKKINPGVDDHIWQLKVLNQVLQLTAEDWSNLQGLEYGKTMDHPTDPELQIRRESKNLCVIIKK